VNSLFRNLDLVILVLALPIFLIASLPLLGYLTGAVIWLLWRGIGEFAERKAALSQDNPGRFAGIIAGSMIGRGWLMGLILIGVGLLTNDQTGLSAALLCVVLFTSSFVVKLISRPTHQPHPAS
jgi:hypothetical protein